MLPPPCFTVGMVLARWWVVPGFLKTWRLAFRPNSSIFVSSDQRILFLMVWESFRCLLANSSRAVMCLPLRSGFRLATLPYRPAWWSAAEMVVLLEGSPLFTEQRWSSVRVTIGFLVTSLTKTLLPRLLSLAGRPTLGRVLVVPNFFHLWMMEATVLIGTFNAADIFLYPSRDLCLDTILSWRSADNSLDFMAWFVLWHALSTVGPYIDRCVPFQIMSSSINWIVETSQWSVETGCTWAQFWVSWQRLWILIYMWFFRFLFLIDLHKLKKPFFTLSLWGIVCRILRKKWISSILE